MLYESSGGIPHGRLAIADGAIRKADVISAVRERNLKPTTSVAHRQTVRENEELKRQNANLQQRVEITQQLTLVFRNFCMHLKLATQECTIAMTYSCSQALYRELGKEVPPDVLRQLTSFQPDVSTPTTQNYSCRSMCESSVVD
jgi:hypothetical protein